MKQPDGFLKYNRQLPSKEQVGNRVTHFKEFVDKTSDKHVEEQSVRCMDCGIPFCHSGCPLDNRIPEFNEAVSEGDWKKAFEVLISTNNFPEFTGRICPAPCEGSCVLGINSDPVSIEYIEKEIIEMAFEKNWVKDKKPVTETGKKVGVIGSGPAGLATADQLRASGHTVTVYEKADRIGGLLRYGIPDFKLEKTILDRRLTLMKDAGVQFKTNQNIGVDVDPKKVIEDNDAVVLCIGSTVPRDLKIEGRQLKGIHFAMEFLKQVNKKVANDSLEVIDCKNKNVLVIGGGDTGSDCIGSSQRLGAANITQLELLTKPPSTRAEDNPWPLWPMILKTSSSHEEGADRQWSILTKRFLSDDGVNLSGVETVKVVWEKDASGKYGMKEVAGTESIIKCEVVFLAIGFVHPLLGKMFDGVHLQLDDRQLIKTGKYQTSVQGLFAAGDARMGQSLVVHAIAEGRKVAAAVGTFLKDVKKDLPLAHPFEL